MATALAAGDIAIVGFNFDNPDNFSTTAFSVAVTIPSPLRKMAETCSPVVQAATFSISSRMIPHCSTPPTRSLTSLLASTP